MVISHPENPLSVSMQRRVPALETYNSTSKFILINLDTATQELALHLSSLVFSFT